MIGGEVADQFSRLEYVLEETGRFADDLEAAAMDVELGELASWCMR